MRFADGRKLREDACGQKLGWKTVFGQSVAITGSGIQRFSVRDRAVGQHTIGSVTGERCKHLAVNSRFGLTDRMFLAPVWRLTPKLRRYR
jgi:hypothetical protein